MGLFATGLWIMGVAITIVAPVIVNVLFIISEIRNRYRYKEAAKAIIRSKDVKVVYVDVYDNNEKKLEELEIRSDKGIDNSILIGQVLNL